MSEATCKQQDIAISACTGTSLCEMNRMTEKVNFQIDMTTRRGALKDDSDEVTTDNTSAQAE